MRVVYMGTPDFAVKPLEALIHNNYEVVGVFTQPDKPVGRKAILTPPPVKVVAESNNIPVFQPDSLKNGEGVKILEEIKKEEEKSVVSKRIKSTKTLLKNLPDAWPHMTDKEKQTAVRQLVDKIILKKGTISVYFKLEEYLSEDISTNYNDADDNRWNQKIFKRQQFY